jgi:membrane-bound serine protease (ClpP class)
MDNGIGIPLLLQLVGVLVIIAEVFLPSGGVLTIIAVAVIGYSLYLVFSISMTLGWALVVIDLISIPILVILGLKLVAKTPARLSRTLSSEEGVTSQKPELGGCLHQTGTSVTVLRPSGTALIDGHRINVVTQGEYINKDTAVEVVAITGNQVIVREKNPS